ncbi:DUF3798 domain-containing protein [Clostridium malenominatum]|uniref:DUF3798 domain-containing protein n=1 Tax=Clostridium malenominatum TaxID=1539 RepID=A0ABN1J7V2_9CLOT
MKKRLLSILLSGAIAITAVGCGSKNNSQPASNTEKSKFKIGVITGTVSQGEEEYRAAENMKKKYGDMIVLQTYPDNFSKEQETTIANTLSLAADPDVKAIVFVQAVPGASAAIDKVKEKRQDILFIAGVPGEDPSIIASKADVVLQADELGMGTAIIKQAKKQGAKTFVHYSFPRHMSYQLLAMRRDILKKTCEEEGIKFVDATAPDPTGDAGVPGAQQFILEDVPRKIKEFGKDTSFFSTNCSMQEPLIKAVLEQGGIMSQQCCPSPYHGYPGALGIQIPEEKKGDLNFIIEETKKKVEEKGGKGRFSTWPVPVNMLFVETGVEYAKAYLEGTIKDKNDKAKLEEISKKVAGKPIQINTFKDEKTNQDLNNFYVVLSDYIDF